METTNDIQLGQVVKSKAGRDKGRIFIVTDILDDKYVMIADGDIRRMDSCKKKKIKHLIIYNSVIVDYQDKRNKCEKVNNAYIRKVLVPFKREI